MGRRAESERGSPAASLADLPADARDRILALAAALGRALARSHHAAEIAAERDGEAEAETPGG